MSAVSGLNAKAEKGRSKYVALDINSLYKGKSLENPKATVQPKHGLQSLGKVGTGRRMPPPANLPSLKSENSGNNPNISLVPSGGQGWGSTTKEKGKAEETNGNQQQSPQSQPASSLSQPTQKTSTTNTVATSGVNKTWSSVTSNQEDGGREQNFLGQQSPFFPQEFPKLAGGDVPTEGNQKSSADTQYGPGPSLRPQTEGSWGRGTLQQQPPAGQAGGQQQSSGSGVNGPQASSEAQPLPSRDQRPYSASRGGNIPSGSVSSTSSPGGPPMGPVPSLGHGPGIGAQMGPGSNIHPPPQFRGMMPSFMFGRNNYPSGYPSNYPNVPPPSQQQNARQPYPYSENRRSQPVRPLAEEEAYQRPAAIITEKALKGFDEILQNDTTDTWATSHGEIDYNAKLVFSDDEESPVSQKKDKSRDNDEKNAKVPKNDKERDRKLERERSVSDRERDNRRETDWSREGRCEKKNEPETDWNIDRADGFERDREERWKTWPQPPQGRSPSMGGGMEMQRQWQPAQQPPQRPFDYRGPPPQPPGSAYASPHARMAAGPVPLMQHGNYPPPRPSRPGQRSSSVADDDELWRQRRKQHTEEMTMTVERARQRRAEEEKHYEQSKQSAQEKAKTFEKNDKEKEHSEIEEPSRSRNSSESREDKPPSRDGRDRDRSQPNYQGYNFSRQFQKNVPPRFQKQAAEYMRQQTQQPIPLVSQSNQAHFLRSQSAGQTGNQSSTALPVSALSPGGGVPSGAPLSLNVNYEAGWGSHPPYISQIPTTSPSVTKGIPHQRSNSQGSASDSYESDTCIPEQPPSYERDSRESYWNRERRQNVGGYDSWNAPGSNEAYYDQRQDFKRVASEKDEKSFDHIREPDRREKEFETQDFRYKGRDSFKEKQSDVRESKEKSSKSNSWSNAHEYEERVSDPFDEPQETNREKIPKDRPDRYEKERWDKERPARPDSRDSRASRDSMKEERHTVERHETGNSQSERERKSCNSREEKKEKSLSLDWGDSPYPVETKRREWHHHPPPITPKQFESIGPPKKNLTPLRRSNAAVGSSTIPEKKIESSKDDNCSKQSQDSSLKKDKEAKEEKNEKIKNEISSKENEKSTEKFEQSHFEKPKTYVKETKKSEVGDSTIENKKDIASSTEKEKLRSDKDKHEHSRNEQNRDRRRDNRDRGGVNSRSRGGNALVTNSQTLITNNTSVRYDSSRGRGSNNGRNGPYSGSNVQTGNMTSGTAAYRGKREYRRSKVERGPRFDRQKEKDKGKDDKKEKHSDDTSGSEIDDVKLGHLRQKDEDSEVSVDEASASTTESAQAEKYQGSEIVLEEEKNFISDSSNIVKDSNIKSDKYKKEKKENSRIEGKTYDSEKPKEERGGFAPRGEPSRRGRGGGGTLSFRNSRGGSRHGPSSYGPPPSRAGFGCNKQEKLEEQKIVEENFTENNQVDFKSNMCTIENINAFPKDSNKSRSLERPPQRRPGRFDHLPPRFQKRNHDRRYDKFDQSFRGRGRGRSGYQSTGNQILNKIGQGGKENLSDVANEEWETASESSDIADRRERRDEKDESRKKDSREKGSSASRKSFSSQRPVNESTQGRRMNTETRRSTCPNNVDRNKTRDSFPRETRPRDSGRGRQNYNNNGDRRLLANNGNNSRPSSSAGHPGSVSGRNSNRNNNPSSKSGTFQPKSETAAVYRVDEIKLQDPNSVQAALTDLTNRRNMKAEVAVSKVPKSDKDKSGGLEGYDLNNYASVVIIDDHPEVGDDSNLLCGTDDGFQEVTSKKRHKVMIENEVKKMKKEPHARNKSGSRSRQSRLPPRFAKQRENFVKSSLTNGATWDLNVDLSSKQASSSLKDTSPAPPSVNAWEKPINHSLRSHSPVITANVPTSSTSNTVVSSCAPTVSEVQVLANTSKSSSFDRSDQHDSGIDVSDQPASAASSQRSSPSNDCKILASTGSVKSTVTEPSDLDITCDTIPPVGSSMPKSKEPSPETDEKKHCISVPFSSKDSFGKTDESSEVKLDFNFESKIDQLTNDKSRSANSSNHLSSKTMNIGRTIDVSSNSAPVNVQSPISPSDDELNLKIQSVKKVWENDPPLPSVIEHTQPTSEEKSCPTSYSSFSSNSDPSNVYNPAVDSGSQTRKEVVDSVEISFRENSPLQQSCTSSSLAKSIEHSSSGKAHMQITAQHNAISGPHCTGPLSPPLMAGLEAMPGIRTITGLASSVQVAGIPAIPSPPTVLFNSSQPMAQTGMYQPLQMDRQTPAAAVAAAMVQFSQSPHGYAPLGTYGLSHQPPPNPQLSNAYGQQSLFVQPPATHQGQDLYSSNQYRVQPPYAQSQHVSSNQVLSAQQNLANSHLLGSQLVQTRPTPGPSPAAPHLQSLHGLQAVQPTPQTSYFSTSAQPQTANYYHQPPTTPGSPMQQQPQYPSHQSYGSQSALNVLPQTAGVTPNFRNFGSHQYKAPSSVMSNIVPEGASLRSTTRSPTIDVSASRNMFNVSSAVSSSMSTTSIAVPSMSNSNVVGKIGQPQSNAIQSNRIGSSTGKTSQYSLAQTQQHYYPFGQQKFSHVQSNTVRPQVLFQNVVRNPPHQQLPAVAAAATNLHYPPPIQRPGPTTAVAQATPQPPQKLGIRPQANVLVHGGKLTSAQQAKLRAEAVQQTQMFFAHSKNGKHDENVSNMLSSQDKSGMQAGSVQKLGISNLVSEDEKDKPCLSSGESVAPCESQEIEGKDLPPGEE
ncbi:protein PRRC2C-like isoform X2 [Uloborus diversus]|uniref:protein PRRC2C-like isoform X2 n=1 Tax=Uloborus diversus TaxID=327109 RepID=UPI002409BCC8|nr:protein PRRC2C-like isoform X2 [Uloborus diversus]